MNAAARQIMLPARAIAAAPSVAHGSPGFREAVRQAWDPARVEFLPMRMDPPSSEFTRFQEFLIRDIAHGLGIPAVPERRQEINVTPRPIS